MNVGIWNRWLATLGGGEHHCLAIAAALARAGVNVTIFAPVGDVSKRLYERFGCSLKGVEFIELVDSTSCSLRKISSAFDIFVNCSVTKDMVELESKVSIALVFFPPRPYGSISQIREQYRILGSYSMLWSNSLFTANWILKWWKLDSRVVYPVVQPVQVAGVPKEKIILTVGRFFSEGHNKNHSIMISAFERLHKLVGPGWRFKIVGGLSSKPHDQAYFDRLQGMLVGSHSELLPNLAHDELFSLYERAAIYWHATGYGVEQDRNPERCEHFGITTVEAMAHGCVPIVFPRGGQTEIVDDLTNGLFWETEVGLVSTTLSCIKDSDRMRLLSENARLKSYRFGDEHLNLLVQELCSSF